MKELIVSLLMYISQNTGLVYDGKDVPMIQFVSKVQLVSIQHQGDVPSGFDYKTSGAIGLYNHENDTIYLAHSIDEKSEYGKSVLLHELTHYLQYQNNLYEKSRCIEELEPLAYKTQNKYLEEHGVDAKFSERHIFFASLCPDSY
ncbi:MAG: DUF6647 family protein [Arenicella sp.]